ncbi:MAG: electron transfer flavoprotein subunit beta/FixA family protein [Proteobacteria bacterium]|nr:electron transfer flavoprotein subunit beta/FixA family protein [Pseudomonadota bacterium]
MKILVPIKRVPDYEQKVKISAAGNSIETSGIKWIVNPFDEIAVEEALKIKEANPDTEVVVATIGSKECLTQLHSTLAMGADRAIHIIADTEVDSDIAMRALAEIQKRDSYDLIILGKQAIDSDANQTGQLLAATLDLPQATFASKVVVDVANKKVTVTREIDGGLETIAVTMPTVITTDLRLNTPRYATLPNIVKAKKKPVEEINLSALNVAATAKVKIVKLSTPPQRKAGVKVSSVAELIDKLTNEAKVI